MMAGIKAQNTRPEILVRRGIFARGYRYRLHAKHLPGRPDLVLQKYNTVIFVHGCFWHRHKCHLFKWPSSRPDFWRHKINGNAKRDRRILKELQQSGWKVLVIWECALKGKHKLGPDKVIDAAEHFVHSYTMYTEIEGLPAG